MKMPAEAREAFDDLLVRPLGSTRALKRSFAAHAEELRESTVTDGPPELGRVLETTQRLLESIERKTSPLYVRLIHALAKYVMGDGRTAGPALPLTAGVVVSVAHSTRRFQLKFEL